MEKEVIKPKEIKYTFAGKESALQTLARSIPKELEPTKKTGYIFGTIFVIVVVIALFKFPLGAMMAGNINISIKVGLPMTFLEFSLIEPSKSPAKINGLIIDLLLYLFIAYAIDVILNLIINNHLLQSVEDKKKRPKVFQDKEKTKTLPEKIIEKSIT